MGFELHEEPTFRPGAEPWQGTLVEGDVFTMEPGLYDPQAGWGVRLENLVHLGPGGPENLTPRPYELDPVEWGGLLRNVLDRGRFSPESLPAGPLPGLFGRGYIPVSL